MAQIFSSNRHEAWLCSPDHPQWVTLADILPQEAWMTAGERSKVSSFKFGCWVILLIGLLVHYATKFCAVAEKLFFLGLTSFKDIQLDYDLNVRWKYVNTGQLRGLNKDQEQISPLIVMFAYQWSIFGDGFSSSRRDPANEKQIPGVSTLQGNPSTK